MKRHTPDASAIRRPLLRAARSASSVLAVALIVACASVTNPVTGDREWTTMTPERERELGEQAALQVEREIGLVEDPELQAYVDGIGRRLARFSPRQDVTYRFAVAEMAEPNAFALPGGWVYVSRGLLALTNSEAELANVIGHEIGHVAARHAAQRQTRAPGVGALTALGAITAAIFGGGEAGQAAAELGQAAGAGYIASYSRDQERESDQVGQEIATNAGWDPTGMPDFLRTLDEETMRQLGEERRPSFLDSHPVTAERVEDATERARRLRAESGTPRVLGSRKTFLEHVDGILVGPDPSEGLFRDTQFLHPALDFALEFPAGWRTVNQPAAVAAQSPSDDAVIVLQAQAESGDPEAAAEAFFQQNPVDVLERGATRVGGYDAYHAVVVGTTQQGRAAIDLTWIDHPSAVFRIAALTSEARFDDHRDTFASTARSFRTLSRFERSGITERRLRVVEARDGESLSSLSHRSGNAWTLDQTAVANALSRNASLEAGTPVKVAVETPYRDDG
jgi:predicted Zn-dependent protease